MCVGENGAHLSEFGCERSVQTKGQRGFSETTDSDRGRCSPRARESAVLRPPHAGAGMGQCVGGRAETAAAPPALGQSRGSVGTDAFVSGRAEGRRRKFSWRRPGARRAGCSICDACARRPPSSGEHPQFSGLHFLTPFSDQSHRSSLEMWPGIEGGRDVHTGPGAPRGARK